MTAAWPIARCNGAIGISGRMVGICIACERRNQPELETSQAMRCMQTPGAYPKTPHMQPPAVRDGGVWGCPERIPPAA